MNQKISCAIVVLFFIAALIGCKPSLQNIDYGDDQCSYCVMNIVDKTHAAQYVTTKGKQFKFDAIECLINQIEDMDVSTIAEMQVADFSNAGTMINAKQATYIVSKNIKSPMGAYLSAVATKDKAKELQQKHTGKIFDWNGIKEELARQ